MSTSLASLSSRPVAAALLLTIVGAHAPDAAAVDYPATVIATPGLVGYWRFEPSSQADSVVNGYTGLFANQAAVGPELSGRTLGGVIDNRAMVLDGNGDYVQTNLDSEVTFGTGGTICAWFNLAVLPSAAGRILYIAGRSTFGDNFDLQIETDDRVRFYAGNPGNAITLGSVEAGRWYFACGTFDTGTNTTSIYLDGAFQASSVVGLHNPQTSIFTIGTSTVFGGRDFNGRLDEVAIFQRALTAAEVKLIYDAAGLFADGFEGP